MWAIAVYDLGLTESYFWKLTPAQFFALLKRQQEITAIDDYRIGVLCAMIVNMFSGKNGKQYYPHDFFATIPKRKPKSNIEGGLMLASVLTRIKEKKKKHGR